MISHKHKFIFIPVRKAAGTSILTALTPHCDNVQKFNCGTLPYKGDENISVGDWESESGRYSDYTVFTIVRNPWDRFISAYTSFLGPVGWTPEKTSLKEYIDNLPSEEENWDVWFHTRRTLMDMLVNKKGNYVSDFSIGFENLEKDFETMCRLVGVPPLVLPHMNRTPNRKHYSTYYDDETRESVREMFKEDIECFDYEFEEEDT